VTKIGLEIHCQLTKLESKLFCSCKADYRGFEPNTNICPICMGIPGSLPLLNKSAVEKATLIAMTLDCKTPSKIAFFRKIIFILTCQKISKSPSLMYMEIQALVGKAKFQ